MSPSVPPGRPSLRILACALGVALFAACSASPDGSDAGDAGDAGVLESGAPDGSAGDGGYDATTGEGGTDGGATDAASDGTIGDASEGGTDAGSDGSAESGSDAAAGDGGGGDGAADAGGDATSLDAGADATEGGSDATAPDAGDAASESGTDAGLVSGARLIAPLTSSIVRSHTPLLHWVLPPGATGAHVEICADQPCSTLEQSFDAALTSGAPTTPLATGVHHWRVHAMTGAIVDPAATVTWPLRVGSINAPSGSAADFNGDGYADLLVGGALYSGSATGTFAKTTVSLAGSSQITPIGDVNADGFTDFACSDAPQTTLRVIPPPPTGNVYVYYGAATGFASTPSVTLAGTDPNGAFGGWIDATDVNGDGISDLVVTASCAPYDTTAQACGGGRMYVFTGGATGLSTTPLSTVSFVNYLQFHQGILAAVGDTNGDGFGDMARGVGSDSNSQTSPLEIWYGSASGFTTANMTTLSVGYVGDALAGLDYNGDGYADVASSFHRFRGYTSGYTIYLGGPNGVTSASGGGGGTTTDFCCALAPAGDVNGDVIGDLNVAQILTLSVNASDSVLCGGGICGGSITSPSSNSPAGFGVGDMNGDGFEDELMTLTGAYSIYFGSPTFGATPLTPDVTLQ